MQRASPETEILSQAAKWYDNVLLYTDVLPEVVERIKVRSAIKHQISEEIPRMLLQWKNAPKIYTSHRVRLSLAWDQEHTAAGRN